MGQTKFNPAESETFPTACPWSRSLPVEHAVAGSGSFTTPSKNVVVAVAIPISLDLKRPRSKALSASTSTMSSLGEASRDGSLDFDTPATSLTATPAEFSKFPKRTSGEASLPISFSKRRQVTRTAGHETDASISADALLARALQEEEYTRSQLQLEPNGSHRRPLMVLDTSDDESDALSDAVMESNVSDAASDYSGLFNKRTAKWGLSTSSARTKKRLPTIRGPRDCGGLLPRRAARTSARRAIDEKLQVVLDSDLSDLSEADSADFSSPVDSILDEEDEFSTHDEGSVDVTSARLIGGDMPLPRPRGRGRAATERWRLERAHPEINTMWDSLEAVRLIPKEQDQQPASINRTLKPFQLEGLNWMKKQERTQWKGGLLGDEMGMGKTIQAVSLIMSDYPQKKPTLVIVPPVALMQWSSEIKDYTDGKLKVLIYHGTNSKVKQLSVMELKKYNVIMISYNSLESLYRKEMKGWNKKDVIVKEDSAIHAIEYHRLILDEAHSIKQRTTGVAKACFALKGKYKWCLSGTPVQNRIGEFFSLLRFLDVQPFANYFCKGCSCSTLQWSITKEHRCTLCNHRALDHVSVFNQEILNPITQSDSDVERKRALQKLRLLTDRIMLRRMKRDYTSSMELPPKEVIIHNEFFGEIERDFSSSIMSNTTRQFDTYVSRGVMLNNYANIFGLIMQMRQVANHPDLLLKRRSAEGGPNVLVCHICDEPAEEAIRSKCKHEFCRTCVKDYIRTCEASDVSPDCPRCHIALAIDLDQPDIEQDEENVKKSSIINRLQMANWTSSTKIEMLVYDLYKLRSKKQTLKSIVFSQFTSMLQLIEWRLRRAGFNTVMLDGSMTPPQRQKSIDHFMNNADVEVFLVSLKAGGVALNLVEASRVFIVDPWWNPAAEWQSADRCHRIGQKRPCVITRLCIEDSVESRIVMLQEKKANMINGTINHDEVAMEKLTPEDMQFLFRGS